jgi:hypothetical protein
MKVKFTREKETPGTVRFKEEGDPADHKVGSLYLKKKAAADLGNPETVTVTIEAN